MSAPCTYEELSERLFGMLPHLRAVADVKFAPCGADEVGDFLVYEDVFNHYLAARLEADSSDARDDELRRIFAFLEELTYDQPVEPGWGRQAEQWLQTRSRELIRVAVIEFLEGRPELWIPRAQVFMGARTRQLLDDAVAERERTREVLRAKPWLTEVEREMLERLDHWFALFERGQMR